MTRASQGSAPVFRAMCPKRTGPGGNYPQWMRTLEEKYQKLHRKITENTSSTGNSRFSYGLGKSVYDTRLSHVLLKYRDIASAKSNTKPNGLTKKSGNVPSECEINTPNREQTVDCKSNTPELYLENDAVDEQTQPSHSTRHVNSTIENRTTIVDVKNHVTVQNDNETQDEGSEEDEEEATIPTPREYYDIRDGKANQSETHGRDSNGTYVGVNKNRGILPDSSKHGRRHIKTSMSRASKLTSRSCPAKLQSKSAANLRKTDATLLSRNTSAQKNSKMFMPMSDEAKHAITETIQEMNLAPTSANCNIREEVQFIPGRSRKCVKNWNVPKTVKPKVVYNTKPVINNAVATHLEEVNKNPSKHGTSNNGDDCSLQSSAGSSIKERLPDIQNEGTINRDQVRNQSYRLPGIGKYDIQPTDSQFEITPPGFDIRYNDMQPVENRDSETPPPDIRQRAIDKCSEWLTKYSK